MISATAALLFASSCFAADPAPSAEKDKLEPVVVKVSKETTYLDGPLLKDGTVDYVTAIDQMNAKGVTQENNAVPLLWKAVGDRWAKDDPQREAKATLLGTQVPDSKAHCFTSVHDLILICQAATDGVDARVNLPSHWQATAALLTGAQQKQVAKLFRDMQEQGEDVQQLVDRAMKSPWAAKDQPLLALWLKVNEEPMKLFVEASRKERYYWPQIGGAQSSMLAMLLPSLGVLNDAGDALVCRALQRIDAGDLTSAWDDYLAHSRLARLIASERIIIAQLVARAMEAASDAMLIALLERSNFSAKQLRAMAREHDELGHPSDFESAFQLTERCMLLETVGMVRRRGMRYITQVAYEEKPLTDEQMAKNQAVTDQILEPNIALIRFNEWANDLVAIFKQPTSLKRMEAAEAFHERLVKLKAGQSRSTLAAAAAALVLPAEERRKLATTRFVDTLIPILLPAISSLVKTDEVARMRREMMQVAFALAIYKAEKKSYPDKLDRLVPDYIPSLPRDRFDEKPLRYQLTQSGYLLYSISSDLKDDQGQPIDEQGGMLDLVIQMPPKVK